MSDYPEHDKLVAVKDESQAVGEFLTTCGYALCEWVEAEDEPNGYYPVAMSIERILAKHYGIDLGKIEKEKRQMLEALRAGR